MTQSSPSVRIAIDRGGTFTDIYAQIHRPNPAAPHTSLVEDHVLKLLSVDPRNYTDAPTEGIRRILALATGDQLSRHAPVQTTNIHSIRMGTTIATNALLERDGTPCALVVTAGMKSILTIGNQSRPSIFDLSIARPSPLHAAVIEADERVVLDRSVNPPILSVRTPINLTRLEADLRAVHATGISSLAVALMHSYARPQHEVAVRDLALSIGFTHVSLSSALTPMVKIVPRAYTATVDAYLTPKLRDYITSFRSAFAGKLSDVDVQFMQSDGGLCAIDAFHGYVAILSGPAGGVVGYARTAHAFETLAPESRDASPRPVIGFDMGGTSTDVSRYADRFDHVFETQTAGVTIQAPQLDINTVAAGGGSRLFFRTGMFYVGPESAGAHPGPVCYRKGGHLAVTDANLFLGRIEPELFPHIFGENADLPLDVDATRKAFEALTKEINVELTRAGDMPLTPEEVADGFIRVANETMCRPIRQLTEAKGHDVREHSLACFGGAGGQHACAIARSLGIKTVFVHKFSGVLSAFGIALADSVIEKQEPAETEYTDDTARRKVIVRLEQLRKDAEKALIGRGFDRSSIRFELYLHLRYEGTDFGIMVPCPVDQQDALDTVDFLKLFVDEYSREHGFHIPERMVVVDDVRVRAMGKSSVDHQLDRDGVTIPEIRFGADGKVELEVGDAKPTLKSRVYNSEEGNWEACEVWRTSELPKGKAVLPGPCTIVDTGAGNTIVVDPGCTARVASDGNVLIDVAKAVIHSEDEEAVDPIKLSIYANRFMGIAEQMGRTLQRTSISTNIKERLDFSCALFDETGGLVANAPHIPVHLGAMQDAVRFQKRALGDGWKEGEVLLSNHPSAGGTHLPDITVITPVYFEGKLVFYIASRGHHADIGGRTPGSMPPYSKHLDEEGLAVRTFKLVRDGLFQEEAITEQLEAAGCRCVRDVISDLRAQVAANNKGIVLVQELMHSHGVRNVQAYMHHIQKAAAAAVRGMLREVVRRRRDKMEEVDGKTYVQFEDAMDDGTAICLRLGIDGEKGTAHFDFDGTGGQTASNTNAPRAVTSSAIIYALRCLVDDEIPLNEGCLEPITMNIPDGSILNPKDGAAVVGGNVLTSQRVTDVILGAFGACAASQGCMNNLTFGDSTMGYYETIGGGSGAGPGWNGASGVQTHMTNTRITDAEILERRYPVVVREFSLREGSGGDGKWRGGDGLVRALEFTRTVTVSLLTERRNRAPWGLEGGQDGMAGRNELLTGGEVRDLGGKDSFDVHEGDVIRLSTPGGGGYGR